MNLQIWIKLKRNIAITLKFLFVREFLTITESKCEMNIFFNNLCILYEKGLIIHGKWATQGCIGKLSSIIPGMRAIHKLSSAAAKVTYFLVWQNESTIFKHLWQRVEYMSTTLDPRDGQNM